LGGSVTALRVDVLSGVQCTVHCLNRFYDLYVVEFCCTLEALYFMCKAF
jgi:hypothetical protein